MCGRTDVAPGARLTDVVEEMGGFEVTQLSSVEPLLHLDAMHLDAAIMS
jgi:hypothetical protein